MISIDYRWKVNNRLVKSILYRYKPALANINVEGRGPAVPLSATNFYRFFPSRIQRDAMPRANLRRLHSGKALWTNPRAEGYSRMEWRNAILDHAGRGGLLKPGTMRSAKLYRRKCAVPVLGRRGPKHFIKMNFWTHLDCGNGSECSRYAN